MDHTRARLVDSALAVVRAHPAPSPEAVAAHAGVSVRTLFRTFGDLEGLWDATRERLADEVAPLLLAGPAPGPLEARIRALVRRRLAVFRVIDPYRRWVDPREERFPAIREGRRLLDAHLRAQAEAFLGAELAAGARAVVPALDALLSYESWRYLRDSHGLGPRKVEALLVDATRRLLQTPS